MTESERLYTDMHADIDPDSDPDQRDEEKEKDGKKLMYGIVALGAVVLIFAVVVIFYALQQYDGAAGDAESAEIAEASDVVATGGTTGDLEGTGMGAIVVARDTDWNFRNANLDDNLHAIDQSVQPPFVPEDDLVFPPPTPGRTSVVTPPASTPVTTPLDYNSLLGVDVLVSQARAQAAGYVVHQVFVCCPDAVRNNTAPPTPGLVLDVQTYTMRQDGQRYMFLHVATTEPYSRARAVPNVDGLQWRPARDRLSGAGLGARFEYERNSTDTKGVVLFQAPQAGRYTPAGSSVIMILAD
ncbi:MAG: PASTA domain-containing protein [Coriobacteriia bacterium]|nr:PASTA domain-containing protein [Coriobacteriia bacterium]